MKSIAKNGLNTFLIIWFGQIVSILGSGLTGFALGVWIYEQTGLATQLGLIFLFNTLPGILVAPLAGVMVDRWDRRWAMILSDSVAAVTTMVVASLLLTNQLEAWHIYITSTIASMSSAFQWPAYASSVALLVPKKHLGRADGLLLLGHAAGQIVSPVLAGFLIVSIQIQGVILIDLATFLFALITILLVRIPKPESVQQEKEEQKSSIVKEAIQGWQFIVARRGLLALLLFFATINISAGFVDVLITPLVLSFSSPDKLGIVLSIGGSGMMIGSLAMSIWGGPKQRVFGVIGFSLLQGLVLLLGGFRPSIPLVAFAAFVFLFSSAFINGSSQVIWQSKTPPALQGRVLALEKMFATASLPIAYLLAGPLADFVFEPLLAEGGALSNTIGRIIGSGSGRGIGLLLIILGVVNIVAVILGYLYPRLRLLESELPDAIPDEEPTQSTVSSLPELEQTLMP